MGGHLLPEQFHYCFFFFFTHDIHILLLQRSRENWELMQYSSLMTKFSDTAHLRDKIQVWRKIELLGKFWENQEKKLKGGKTEFAAVSCFHTRVYTYSVLHIYVYKQHITAVQNLWAQPGIDIINCNIYFLESLCFRMQLMHVTAFREGTEKRSHGGL